MSRFSVVSGRFSVATAYCLLPTTYCPLPTAYYLLPTAYYLLPTMPRPLPGSDDGPERYAYIGKGLPGENTGIDEDRLSVRGVILTNAEEALLRELLAAYTNQVEHGAPAAGAAVSAYLTIPALRGLWPGSSFDQTGTLYDVSGQARHMTATGSQIPTPYYTGRTGIISLSRRNDEAYTTPDNNALDFTTKMSMGLWLKLDPAALPAAILGKMGVADYAYGLSLHAHTAASAAFRFYHSPDGATLNYNEITTTAHTAWHFLGATFDSFDGPALYLDDRCVVAASGPTASLHANTQPLTLGYSAFQSINTLDAAFALAFVSGFNLHLDHMADLYHTTRRLFGA